MSGLSLVAVFDSILPTVATIMRDDSATFTVPESRLVPTVIGGVLTLKVEGVYSIGEKAITVENVSGDGVGGLVPEGANVDIDGNSYVVDKGTRVSVDRLKLNIATGLVVGLTGGESVTFTTADITVDDVVSLSVESFSVAHSEGEAAFGFQFTRVGMAVLPAVGWFCQKGTDKGHVIFVDTLPNIVIVWIGKVTKTG